MVIVDMGRVVYYLMFYLKALSNTMNMVNGFIGQDMEEDIVNPAVQTTSSTTQPPTIRTTLEPGTNSPLSITQSPLLGDVAGYMCEDCREYFLDNLYRKLIEGRTADSLDPGFQFDYVAKPLLDHMCLLGDQGDNQLVKTWVDKLKIVQKFDTDGDSEISNEELFQLNFFIGNNCRSTRRRRHHRDPRTRRLHAHRFPD